MSKNLRKKIKQIKRSAVCTHTAGNELKNLVVILMSAGGSGFIALLM